MRRVLAGFALVVSLLALVTCLSALIGKAIAVPSACSPTTQTAPETSARVAAASATAPASAPASAPAPALDLEPVLPDGLVRLPVPGFGDALASLPRNAAGPEPVLIAAHGRGGKPEDLCTSWRDVIGDPGFILCPRGVALPQGGYGFDAHFGAEVDADVAALRARYGLAIAAGPMVYSGYSQGAYEGPAFVMKNPMQYSRVLLVEGGEQGWNPKLFAAEGGQRVLFACGQASCDTGASTSAAALERAGVPSRVLYSPGAGHSYWGSVAAQIAGAWPWLVAGDPRWNHTWPPKPWVLPARPPPARHWSPS